MTNNLAPSENLPASPDHAKNKIFSLAAYRPKVAHLAWLVLVLLLLPRLGSFLSHSWEVLNWEWQIDFDEGFNLDAAWKLANGTNIYAQPTPDRFIAAPYPPFYYVLSASFLKIFGLSMLGGRLLSFGATLALAGLIGLLARRLARRYFGVSGFNGWMAGLVAGLIWLALNPTIIWATFYKQDMLAMALAVGGLGLTLAWDDDRTSRWKLVSAAGLLALAFYTKQNELAAVVAAMLYFALKDWRRTWRFQVLLLALLIGPFIVADLLTRHRFYFNVFEAQQVPWIADDLWRRLFGRIVPDHLVFIGLALIFAGFELARAVSTWRKRRWCAPDLMTVWLAGGTFTLVTVGSYQSGYNHALNFFPPVIVAACGVLAWAINKAEVPLQAAPVPYLLAWGLVVAIAGQFATYPESDLYYSPGGMPSANRAAMYRGLVREISQSPGDILSEDIYLQLKMGRPVVYDDLYHMRLQAQAGQWDERKFLADMRARRFGLILLGLEARRFTREGFRTLEAHYKLTFPDGIELWRPRSQPLLPQHAASCTLGEALQFAGASYGRDTSGNVLNVTTYWQTQQPLTQNYTLFLHLTDENGKLLAQRDESPNGWRVARSGLELASPTAQPFPTSGWQPGEWLLIDQTLPLPAGFDLNQPYRLILGGYLLKPDGSLDALAAKCNGQPTNPITLPRVR